MHVDLIPASRIAGQSLRQAGESDLLTDQQVADATNIAGIEANVTGTACHADLAPLKARINQGLELGSSRGINEYDDTTVQAATTVNGLASTTESQAGELGVPE